MITGQFNEVSVPAEIPVGEDIKVHVNYSDYNDHLPIYDPAWKSFVVIVCPGLNNLRVVDANVEWFANGGDDKTYNIGKMPDKQIFISVFLFAHDDATYSWDWYDFDAWMEGYPAPFTHLDSEYRLVSPGGVPGVLKFDLAKPVSSKTGVPGGTPITLTCPVTSRCSGQVEAYIKVNIYEGVYVGKGDLLDSYISNPFSISPNQTKNIIVNHTTISTDDERRDVEVEVWVGSKKIKDGFWQDVYTVIPGQKFTGNITSVKPSAIAYGARLDIFVSFNAYATQEAAWYTQLYATLDGMGATVEKTPWGENGSEKDVKLYFGMMPNKNLSGQVILRAREGFLTEWIELDRRPIAVAVVTAPPECSVDADCPAGYVCENGVCVPEEPIECTIDAHCPPGYVCKNGVCVPEAPPGEEFPWLPVALIGGGAILAAAALIKPKKKPAS